MKTLRKIGDALEDAQKEKHSRLTADFDRAFYARLSEPARYACNWITLSNKNAEGEKKGGAKVCIGDGGRIEKGPKALRRKKIGSLVGPQNAVDDAIRTAARQHGVKKADLRAAAEDVLAERRELAKEREEHKRLARQWVGMSPSEIERLKNRYLDYDSIPGFDDAASELVNSHPELGIHPENASEGVWELIQEPRENLPKKTDPEILAEAAERLKSGAAGRRASELEDIPESLDENGEYIPFSRMRQAFDRAFYARGFPMKANR